MIYLGNISLIRMLIAMKIEFPARIALASVNLIYVDGLPLLKSSLSIAGKSSCINVYVWINSTDKESAINSLKKV